MGRKGSFVQAYNAQIAMDSNAQIIVAAELTQGSNDQRQLAPMLEQVEQNMGAKTGGRHSRCGLNQRRHVFTHRVAAVGDQREFHQLGFRTTL